MAYWPLPNTTPTNQFTQTSNFSASGVSGQQRRPHRLARRPRVQRPLAHVRPLLVLERGATCRSTASATPASSAGGDGPTFTKTHSLSVDHNYTLGPTWMLNVRYGLNRRFVDRLPLSAGFDLASLGFPSNVIDTADALRVPARQRAELPVARPEHVHRPGDRADDAQLQRQRDQGVGRAHDEDGRRLPQVPAQLHPAVLPVGPVQLQQRAVDAAQPERRRAARRARRWPRCCSASRAA